MNAKKIMGAVLVALLALTAFAGVAAADYPSAVFAYQKSDAVAGTDKLPAGTWTSGKATFTVGTDGIVIPGNDFVAGTYQLNNVKVYASYPTATIVGTAGDDESAYVFTGATYYGGVGVAVTQSNAAGLIPVEYQLTFPNATTISYDYANPDKLNKVIKGLEKGTYKLALKFNFDNFMLGMDAGLLVTAPISFTVAGAEDATLSASVDQMIKGEEFVVTVAGKPGITYAVNATQYAFNITKKQPGIEISAGNATIVMPNTGKVSFTMAGNTTVAEKEQTLKLMWYDDEADTWNETKAKVTVKFMKGVVSDVKADAASYFVGDVVTITGSTTAGKIKTIDIKGTNFEVKNLQNTALEDDVEYEGDATKTFTIKLNTSKIQDGFKKLDVGIYTITLNTTSGVTAVVPVTLKQPFISIVEAPEVIVKNTDAEFIINAEATDKIAYYIFGTNYFDYSEVETHVEDEDGEDIENQFLVELKKGVTKEMDAGQYFAVFQHPMYDGKFQVVVENFPSSWTISGKDGANIEPINVKERQTANAAQALCDALDSQLIDDMYVKYSFFVVGEGESFEISELPTEVVKGDKIVITGVDTAHKGEYVTAEMISTAFAAVPKETVGSAAFIVVTAQINEDDGTFELTLDTSDLNVDEYSLSVAINSVTQKTTTINVVEADEPVNPEQPEEPEQPEQPEQPTEPTTPGFGALAALAGLGAVAVLLLRRE